jgi:uncharacterized protein YdbL (DUF1318 family)
MLRMILMSAVLAMALGTGCAIKGRQQQARTETDVDRIGKQADAVLDYIEGKSARPPNFDLDGAPGKPEDNGGFEMSTTPTKPKNGWLGLDFELRRALVAELKHNGCLGENNRGRVDLFPCDALADPKEFNAVQKTLAEENKDRKSLYREIALRNRIDNFLVSRVERVYALKRLQRAQSGQVVQLPAAGEDFEIFRRSPLGQRLAERCVPEAWVTVP